MRVLILILVAFILISVVGLFFQSRGPEAYMGQLKPFDKKILKFDIEREQQQQKRIFLVIAVLLILLFAFLVFRTRMLVKVLKSLKTKPCTIPMDTFQPLLKIL